MHSFIELPRMDSRASHPARHLRQHRRHHRSTKIGDHRRSPRGHSPGRQRRRLRRVRTYMPIASLLDILGMLADNPGVSSWSALTKAEWYGPGAGHLATIQ